MSADTPGGAAAGAVAGSLSPGEHLRAEIERLGLDQIAVSKAAGVSRQTVNNIVNGRQPISRGMAAKLARLTGRSADYWLRDCFPRHEIGRRSRAPQPAAGTGVLNSHQILRALKEGGIRIEPLSAVNVLAASVTLTLGPVIISGHGRRVELGRRREFLLEAGQAAQVTTCERLELSGDYLGRAGAAARLARAGIMVSLAMHIEPGFRGPIQFSLFNPGGAPFRLRAGEAIVSLELARLWPAPG